MIEMGKNSHRYFDRQVDENGRKHYELKSLDQYSREQGKQEQPSKRYFSATTLTDLIKTYPILRKDSMSSSELEKGNNNNNSYNLIIINICTILNIYSIYIFYFRNTK